MNGKLQDLNGSVCALIGAGRSNIALAKYLSNNGATIYLCDEKLSEDQLNLIIEENKIKNCKTFPCGVTKKVDFVFRTPVIRPDSDVIQNFIKAGAFLTSEVELFFGKCKAKIIGITGSDGKTTTATITSELYKMELRNFTQRVFLGGNIGVPLISLLDEIRDNDTVIAELSSFQLMTMTRSPGISAVTNISENHLDWHTDINEYICSKSNIFKFNECKKLVIECGALEQFKRRNIRNPDNTIIIGDKNGFYFDDKSIYIYGEKVIDTKDILIKGKHNLMNFIMACAVSYPSVSLDSIKKIASEFRGVPHRIEFIGNYNGISYFNSSIDSTPTRTVNTLKCFQGDITLICGGYDKNLDYSQLAEYVNVNVKNIVLYGVAADKINAAFKMIGNIRTNIHIAYNFDEAFIKAVEHTEKGGSVLLSPACASFDQFKDFEQRGNRFSQLVKEM